MNLLVLSSWFPYPPGNGSRIRAYYLLRELVRAGHTIRLVAGLQNDVADEKNVGLAALREMGIVEVVAVPWKWYGAGKSGIWGAVKAAFSPVPRSILETPNPALTQVIAEQLARPTDAVLVFEMGMDAYLPALLPPDVPTILDGVEASAFVQNALMDAKRKAGVQKSLRYWQKRLRRYTTLTTVSQQESEAVGRALVKGMGTGTVVVFGAPNGVDTAAYPGPSEEAATAPGRLIYNGSPTYGPNRDAVLWFAREILPRVRNTVPHAHLYVTGRHTASDAALFVPFGDAVHLTGFIPDLRPVLAEAAVCVVPLLSGGGTRLKILEAWAAGLPVVSTTIGAAGLDGAEPGTHFLQADTPINFADATIGLLTDPARCRKIAANARALAERYDWARIGEAFNELLLETCRANIPS